MSGDTGPFLQVGAFCEKVLHEQDGVISLIRIVDRINRTARGPAAPKQMEPFEYRLFAVIALKSGLAKGRHEVRIKRELPSGLIDNQDMPPLEIHLEGEDRGANVVAEMAMMYEHEGLYWFHVFLDSQLLTKMPLRIVYLRAPN